MAQPTLGAQIDALYDLRNKITAKTKEVDALKAKKAELEVALIEALDSQDTVKSTGKKATASISEHVVPSVEDWDAFYRFITRNKAWYLLQRRTCPAPYRELLEQRKGRKIPGVTSVVQRTLNLRVVSK